MTPTEDLLSSTLAQEAASITSENLRPLDGSAIESQLRSPGLYQFAQRRLRALAAVAAAVSVLLVSGVVMMARSMITVAPPFANVGTATSPPPYYVEIDENDQILVQSTATGQRTDLVKVPFAWSGGMRQDCGRSLGGWSDLRCRLQRLGRSAN